jgi:capsule biosynthesis phosphatase
MKRLVVDMDGTITRDDADQSYADREPNADVVAQVRAYHNLGYTIVIYSSRNVRSFDNSIGKINAHTLPVMIEWLRRHEVPYDEIYVGKPWCGTEGFYVDDRAVRPSEFIAMSPEEILALIGDDKEAIDHSRAIQVPLSPFAVKS